MNIYWLTLKASTDTFREFGITARNRDDATNLLMLAVEAISQSRIDADAIESVREIESSDELDQKHVVPNMGVIVRRGVWYPNLPNIQ